MIKQLIVAGLTAAALAFMPVSSAQAGNRAEGGFEAKTGGAPKYLGEFSFYPRGNRVDVYDAYGDNWEVLVELWWGGKLRRWCYNRQGGLTTQTCHFKIRSGQNIRFFIAEIEYDVWKHCKRRGCGKRRHFWAGPFGRDGCRANRFRAPCAYLARSTVGTLSDFLGEA
jgi:hypothetical protein